MIITGLAALSKFDMRKIIALLTLSQLGVIFFSGVWGGGSKMCTLDLACLFYGHLYLCGLGL